MADRRFVKCQVGETGNGEQEEKFRPLGYVWGLFDDNVEGRDPLTIIYTRSRRALRDMSREIGERGALTLYERKLMVDATEENTPGAAWAALAKYKLLGEDGE